MNPADQWIIRSSENVICIRHFLQRVIFCFSTVFGTWTTAEDCCRHQLHSHDPQHHPLPARQITASVKTAMKLQPLAGSVGRPSLAAEGRPKKSDRISRKHQQLTQTCQWLKHWEGPFVAENENHTWLNIDKDHETSIVSFYAGSEICARRMNVCCIEECHTISSNQRASTVSLPVSNLSYLPMWTIILSCVLLWDWHEGAHLHVSRFVSLYVWFAFSCLIW